MSNAESVSAYLQMLDNMFSDNAELAADAAWTEATTQASDALDLLQRLDPLLTNEASITRARSIITKYLVQQGNANQLRDFQECGEQVSAWRKNFQSWR